MRDSGAGNNFDQRCGDPVLHRLNFYIAAGMNFVELDGGHPPKGRATFDLGVWFLQRLGVVESDEFADALFYGAGRAVCGSELDKTSESQFRAWGLDEIDCTLDDRKVGDRNSVLNCLAFRMAVMGRFFEQDDCSPGGSSGRDLVCAR